MKRLIGFLSCTIFLLTMAFTASSHPPIEKHPIKKNTAEFKIAEISIFIINETVPVIHYEFGDVTVNMHVEYDKVGLYASYLMPKNLKNKDHRPWLFSRIKLC